MSYLLATISDRLDLASAPITAYPFTLAVWVKETTDTAAERFLVQVGVSGSANNYQAILIQTSDAITCRSRDGSGNATAATSAIAADSAWHHAAMVGTSATDRAIFFDGANKVSDTNSRTATGLNALRFGRDLFGANNSTACRLGQMAIWASALSDANILSLGGGAVPNTIGTPVVYYPCTADASDAMGGTSLTVTGATLDGDNPPVGTPPFVLTQLERSHRGMFRGMY